MDTKVDTRVDMEACEWCVARSGADLQRATLGGGIPLHCRSVTLLTAPHTVRSCTGDNLYQTLPIFMHLFDKKKSDEPTY